MLGERGKLHERFQEFAGREEVRFFHDYWCAPADLPWAVQRFGREVS
jgi:hypothetical protein